MRSDPLSPDNGGVSGAAYSSGSDLRSGTDFQPAAPRPIRRPALASGSHLSPTLWAVHLADYYSCS